jgi:His/Glu/Gln/Arg/opine family amino acid ABC transporter permease subunit
MLYGFSGVILQGALVTLELAISSVVLAVLIGLAGAGAKLSANKPLALIFEGYTTLIRGVPDLVLMLLIFYGLQIALNSVTDAMGWDKLISTRWWPVLLPSVLSTVPTSPKLSAVLTWPCRKVTLRRQPHLVLPLHKRFADHVPGHDALCASGHR